jgi:hypothetical protein
MNEAISIQKYQSAFIYSRRLRVVCVLCMTSCLKNQLLVLSKQKNQQRICSVSPYAKVWPGVAFLQVSWKVT